jgi:hypothetical protein
LIILSWICSKKDYTPFEVVTGKNFINCLALPWVMTEIKLDFSRYWVQRHEFWEVESDVRMNAPFGHGYAKGDFVKFLNFVVALNLNKDVLIPSSDAVGVSYRFERLFPEPEKKIIKAVMGLRQDGIFEDDLAEEVLKSIDDGCVLIGRKTDAQREKLGIYSLDDYFPASR